MSGDRLPRERSARSLMLRSVLGALWFALWFFVAFPALILFALGESWSLQPGFHLWAAGALVAIANAVLIAEIVAFVRWGGTHVPFDPPPSLVASGLYRRVRNPMYASYVAIAFGEAIAYRSWALFGYSLALAMLAHGYVILVEEPALRRRFGEEYERYTAHSSRWFPRVGGPAAAKNRPPPMGGGRGS